MLTFRGDQIVRIEVYFGCNLDERAPSVTSTAPGASTPRSWPRAADERPGALLYRCTGGEFALYLTEGRSPGTFTQMGFEVDDIETVVAECKRRGVVFEEVDVPGLRTVDGIADIEGNYPSKRSTRERAACAAAKAAAAASPERTHGHGSNSQTSASSTAQPPADSSQPRRSAPRCGGLGRDAHIRRRVAPHQFRHCRAIELVREAVPVHILQRPLGHANLAGATTVYLSGMAPEEVLEVTKHRKAPSVLISAFITQAP